MNFYIISNSEQENLRSRNAPYFLLRIDNWNDFNYRTQFYTSFIDEKYEKHDFGFTKIVFDNIWKEKLNPDEFYNYVDFIPKKFSRLEGGFYSVGDIYFYKRLKEFFKISEMRLILNSLNDIAVDLSRLEEVLSKDLGVVGTSLMRDYKREEIRNKIHRMANGGVELTPYYFNFEYLLNNMKTKKLDFKVEPNSLPPTNIHVVIGGNGVGKTTFLNTILKEYFEGEVEYPFASGSSMGVLLNLVVVSYSPFDRLFKGIDINSIKNRKYSYIGLREDPTIYKTENYKNISETNKEFVIALFKCKHSSVLKEKWLHLISILEIDGYFKNRNLKELIELIDIKVLYLEKDLDVEQVIEKYTDKILEKNEEVIQKFQEFSSGHKIILLSLTSLVAEVIEKSLVIYDEPETYLHPPLISAYIRALSWLMIDRNAVAVIATHSPVILQEVPRKSVWIISREGDEFGADRPPIETFGESVSTLTKEVFNLKIKKSGFYTLLEDTTKKVFGEHSSLSLSELYDLVVDKFNGEVGDEAQNIIISIINKMKRD
ncbi:ATP-binding protein [Acinetobacter guerrae]|uniref:ATP-binding protein n=1 Tax=Acinetobacter guerrae TaxID=1843371 RepID=A0A3A8EAV6_9GAMM|nr:AAA family ATPase [Acinetobacter guerrae]RKG31805.1 ATP-binding protein [Acinetobacter guerrae]